MLTHIKQVLNPALPVGVRPVIHRHRADHVQGVGDKQLHNPVLHRRKARVPVQENHAVFQHLRARQFPAQNIQNLLRRDIVIRNIILEFLKDQPQIPQLLLQQRVLRLPLQQLQILRRNSVLTELGNLRFQLIDETSLSQMAAVEAKTALFPAGNPAQDHGFSHVVQHHRHFHRQLVEHPVGQALEAQDVDVHDAVPWVQADDLLLGLHGKLLRHHHQKTPVRLFQGQPDGLLIQIAGFSGTGTAENKL